MRVYTDRRKPRTAVIVSALLCALCATLATRQLLLARDSAIVEMSRQSFDFGEVPEGTKVKHSFVLHNKATAQLSIASIRSSCPCLSSRVASQRVPPRGSTVVEIVLDTHELVGPACYSTILTFRNRREPIVLRVHGNVFSPSAVFSPGRVDFGEVLWRTGSAKTIVVLNKDRPSARWKIISADADSPYVAATYASDSGRLTCTLSPHSPLGPFQCILKVKSVKSGQNSVIQIPVSASVVGPVKAVPRRLFLGTVRVDTRCEKRFSLVKVDPSFARSLASFACSKGIDLIRPGEQNCVFSAKIVAPPEPGVFTGEIVLTDDTEEAPPLRIPYSGLAILK